MNRMAGRKKNLKKIIVLFLLETAVLCIMITTITLSFVNQDKLMTKNIQIDTMYENWLVLRDSVLSYISSPSPGRFYDRTSLLSSFENFDSSMAQISENDVYSKIERHYPQTRDIRQCLIYNWQKIQYQLISLLQTGQNLDEFNAMILWVARDTQEMDRFFGLLRYFIQKENKKQQKFNLIVSYIIVIALILISSFAIFWNSKMKNRLAYEEEMQKMTRTMLRIRDGERKRIALDIHDSLVHRLRELNAYVGGNVCKGQAEHLSGEISSLIDIARDISFNLIPFITSSESGEDFVNVIKNYAAEILMSKNITLNISSVGMGRIKLPEDFRINMFRIIQEILNNVVKYSECSKVTVKFLFSHPYVIFSVADDGKGISNDILGAGLSRDHIGLYGMQERVKLFSGTISFKSENGNGTKITVKIPLRENRW